jgi:iron complex outermembrane receptor protein
MYYISPVDQGNPQLHPEESVEYELGITGRAARWKYSSAIFHRRGKNLIDWVRVSDVEPWHAMNISQINMNGIEFNTRYIFSDNFGESLFQNMRFSYTYLQADQSLSGYQSKYVLNYLKQQALASLSHYLFLPGLVTNWQIRYEDRINASDYWLTDLKISFNKNPFSVYLEATNLFDISYETQSDIPMPGRWVKFGFTYKISFDLKE